LSIGQGIIKIAWMHTTKKGRDGLVRGTSIMMALYKGSNFWDLISFFPAIYQFEKKVTDSREEHGKRHDKNEHKNKIE
jgi:hypothetical protein